VSTPVYAVSLSEVDACTVSRTGELYKKATTNKEVENTKFTIFTAFVLLTVRTKYQKQQQQQ
jgi:hypothetical protein